MKLFVKFLITALVLAIILPFTFIKGKDGKPLMSLGDLKAPEISLPSMPEAVKNADLNVNSVGKDIVYKWRDEKGALHFSSTPPSEGTEYSAKGYDPNTNLIQAITIKVEEPEQAKTEPENKKVSILENPYSPAKVEKLIKDAQNVQKLLNDRVKKQEAMLGQ